jgi:hypothetical protein
MEAGIDGSLTGLRKIYNWQKISNVRISAIFGHAGIIMYVRFMK